MVAAAADEDEVDEAEEKKVVGATVEETVTEMEAVAAMGETISLATQRTCEFDVDATAVSIYLYGDVRRDGMYAPRRCRRCRTPR